MTDMELTELGALAKAATPGPWEESPNPYFVHDGHFTLAEIMSDNAKNDAAYIAAANPATIQEMVADLKKARADACEWVSIARWLARELGKDAIPETEWIILARQALGFKNEWGEDGEATCTK